MNREEETIDQTYERLIREQHKSWKIPSHYDGFFIGENSWSWYPEHLLESTFKKGFLVFKRKVVKTVIKYKLTVFDMDGNSRSGYWEDDKNKFTPPPTQDTPKQEEK